VGRLLAGFLAIFFINEKVLLSCVVFAILIFFVALTIKEKKEKVQIKKFFQYFDLKNKHPLFLRGFFLCFLIGISVGLSGSYVLPLFLKSLSFETKNIGILLGFQTLLMGIFIFFFGKLKKKKWFLIGLFYSIILFLISYFKNPFLVSLLVLLLGITYGIVPVFNEDLFSRLIKDGSFATDIGILTLAIHLGRALSLSFSGFLVNLFGFWSVFFLGGIIFILFLVFYK
jgi:predicted MFS family arabinose efflux permease